MNLKNRTAHDGANLCGTPGSYSAIPTRTVRIKATGSIAVINATDFDGELHDTNVTPPAPAPARKGVRPKIEEPVKEEDEDDEAPKPSARYTRGALAQMTSDALKALPEWQNAPAEKTKGASTKEDIINIILGE